MLERELVPYGKGKMLGEGDGYFRPSPGIFGLDWGKNRSDSDGFYDGLIRQTTALTLTQLPLRAESATSLSVDLSSSVDALLVEHRY